MADDILQPDPLLLLPTTLIQPPPPTLTPILSPTPQPDPLDPPKRQRRPSVRLGEIGDPTYDPRPRSNKSTWQHQPNTNKTRPLTNLINSQITDKPKFRKPTTAKRARTNWTKFELPASNLLEENGNNDDQFRVENSDNSVEEENMGLQYWDKLSRGNGNNTNNTNNNNSVDEEKEEESVLGVRDWLNGLGLGKYGPVFDIHEVDEEVLPLLTLEDLKDMGINAVGSRRKMYSAILKLNKGLS